MDSSKTPLTSQSVRHVLPSWFAVAKIWFYSNEKWKARAYMVSVLVLAYMNTYLSVKISYAQRNFSTALSEKRADEFRAAVLDFVVIIALAAPCTALTGYVEQRLMLAWRTYLTQTMLSSYFSDRAFFNIKQAGEGITGVDNPDQRICDDVRAYVDSSVAIVVALVLKAFKVVAFAGVLWSISPSLVYFLLLYTGFGTTALTWIFGRPLMKLFYKSLNSEADMRFSLVRVRENAESIAFYGGEARERQVVMTRLGSVVAIALQRIKWQSMYELWSRIYSWATILIPPLLTAPRYFAGEIEFGVVSQCSYVFSQVEAALSVIVDRLDQLSGLAAQTQRLDALVAALAGGGDAGGAAAAVPAASSKLSSGSSKGRKVLRLQAGMAAGPSAQDDDAARSILLLERLTVCTPGSQHVICRDLDLHIAPGESLLVVGPSGCGKSSLLRVIAGLWVQGSGTIVAPDPASLFFLPQKPYMPLGNLRQQLLFPSRDAYSGYQLSSNSSSGVNRSTLRRRTSDGTASAVELLPLTAADVSSDRPSDSELEELLQRVRLPDLVRKCGGLDSELDWSHVLSLGEQQRLAFARLLLHAPQLAFLDEATSALDGGSETWLYQQLQRSSTRSYVSVGHRLALVRFHTHVLECVGGGRWVRSSAAEFLRREEAKDGLQL